MDALHSRMATSKSNERSVPPAIQKLLAAMVSNALYAESIETFTFSTEFEWCVRSTKLT